MGALIGGWATGAVVGRRPAGPVRDAVHPGSGVRGLLVVVDERFTVAAPPDHDLVARTAAIAHPAIVPVLDAGLLEDGTRWYVTAAPPAPVLDAEGGCSPRRAALVAEGVARALVPLHAAGLAHGLVGAHTVVPVAGRHRDGGSGSTLLLDAGLAPLLGDGADALAQASGVVLPADRGPAADVHALGGLLLRMLTAAAPAGAALDALPVGLRSLLSAMLEADPAARPSALAAAARLAELQDGLPATAPIELPAAGPAAVQRPATGPLPVQRATTAAVPARRLSAGAQPVQRTASAGTPVQRATTASRGTSAAAPAEGRVRVPAPLHAEAGAPQQGVLPSAAPEPGRAMQAGSTPVVAASAARRPRSVRRVLVATGGLGLAALLVGVVTHLPAGGDVGVHAAAAGTGDALTGAGPVADRTPAPSSVATSPAAAGTPKAAKHRAEASAAAAAQVGAPAAATAAPSFARPAAAVPSPLTAATGKPTPSRTATPTRTPVPPRTSTPSRTPAWSTPSWTPTPTSSTGGSPALSTATPAAPTATPTRTSTPASEPPSEPSGGTTREPAAPATGSAPVEQETVATPEPVLTPSSLPSTVESVLPTAAPEDQAAETTAADGTPAPNPGSRRTRSPQH